MTTIILQVAIAAVAIQRETGVANTVPLSGHDRTAFAIMGECNR